MKIPPMGSEGIALFERIKRCSLVGVSISLGVGFEVPEAYARSRGSLSLLAACLSGCRTLSYQVCLCVPMFPATRKMD